MNIDEALADVALDGVAAGHAATAVGAEVGPAVDRLVRSLERALGMMQAIPEVRRMRRLLRRSENPRPLAPGCLAASKLARRDRRPKRRARNVGPNVGSG